jgi:hypothetical protein
MMLNSSGRATMMKSEGRVGQTANSSKDGGGRGKWWEGERWDCDVQKTTSKHIFNFGISMELF